MAFKCPNCGGFTHYDIAEKRLKCDSCGQLISIELEAKAQGAQEYKDTMGMTSFVCRSCGAEILAPEDSIVGYCSYCGSESMLEGQMTEEIRPKYIMPFTRTKDECKKVYSEHTSKLFYLPNELKDPEYLEKFRGTYIPYWMYNVNFPGYVSVKGVIRKKHGGDITEDTYDVTAKIDGEYEGIPYDASSCFDDTISDMLMPFDKKNLKEFNPSYLAGFYADRADVNPEVYEEEAAKQASTNAYSALTSSVKASNKISLNSLTDSKKQNLITPSISDKFTALFPVWFLTWRQKDRVAYAIVNGQSGKLSCDLPVDMKKFSLATLGTAAILFALLTLLVSMTAGTALILCSFMALITLILFNFEVRQIVKRENHIGDRGYFVEGREVKMPQGKRERLSAKEGKKTKGLLNRPVTLGNGCLMAFIAYIILAGVPFTLAIFNDAEGPVRLVGFTAIFFLVGAVFTVSSLLSLRYVKEKSMILFALIGFLSLVIAVCIAVWNPVNDIYYYYGCLGCGVAAAVLSVGLIRYYNLLTTRPVPTFFDREGGRDSAED